MPAGRLRFQNMNTSRFSRFFARLVILAAVFAWGVMVLSAYARLSEAVPGCAGGPECHEAQAVAAGSALTAKRIHSQAVSVMGLLVLAIFVLAWARRAELGRPQLAAGLLALVVFLALFGIMATGRLPRPVVVPVHLLGGMLVLALLVWLALRHAGRGLGLPADSGRAWRVLAGFGLALLLAQIMLGGWLGADPAMLACESFPLCGKGGLPAVYFGHLAGAAAVVACQGWLALRVLRMPALRPAATALLALLPAQVVLGAAITLSGRPLPAAVAHNALAGLLVIAAVALNFRLRAAKSA